jgi:hypothetical protein
MQYHLAFTVLIIFYLFINTQSADNSTVVQNVTVVATTEHVMVVHTTSSMDMNATSNVSHKAIVSPYVEPPPHPLGYCIRSRLTCSKIRRCCTGPCNVNKNKCP